MSDLVRVGAPDSSVIAVRGMTGTEYTSRDGMFAMSPADAACMRIEGGFTPSIGAPVRGGYACPCGFRPIFRNCSRCGAELDERFRS